VKQSYAIGKKINNNDLEICNILYCYSGTIANSVCKTGGIGVGG
jgi:hypothetical protein